MTLSGRSADIRKDVKEPLSENFDDKSVGDIVSELAGRHGYGSKVDAEFAETQLPYVARTEQSAVDFLTRLADRSGALFSIKDGKFLFLKRGGLPAVSIDRSECEEWDFSGEPRPLFGKTQGGWFDRAKGKVVYEDHSTGADGPAKRLRGLLPGQGEAKAAAKSEGDRLGRKTGSGSVTMAGRPELMADAPIDLTGFRGEISGRWRCSGVDHVYSDAYRTTASVEATEEGKK